MDTQTEQALLTLLKELVTAVAAMRDEIAALREEVKAKPEPAKRTRKSKKAEPAEPAPKQEESQFAALEDAVWTAMKNDYGDDVRKPNIGQKDESTFLVDGEELGPQQMQTIMQTLVQNPAGTPAEVAAAVGLSLPSVYLVQWMMAAQKQQA